MGVILRSRLSDLLFLGCFFAILYGTRSDFTDETAGGFTDKSANSDASTTKPVLTTDRDSSRPILTTEFKRGQWHYNILVPTAAIRYLLGLKSLMTGV